MLVLRKFDDETGVAVNCTWYEIDGNEYWYENGVRQGLQGRGKEIYDPASNTWYWLDSIDGGNYQTGVMAKGWLNLDGVDYYFDKDTGILR